MVDDKKMVRIDNIKLPVEHTEADLKNRINKLLKRDDYKFVRIVRRSLDARKKSDIHYNYCVQVELGKNEEKTVRFLNNKNITLTETKKYSFPYKFECPDRPIIIGSGPAGYFAATVLADNGLKPIVIERGKPVEERKKDVDIFWETGKLNEESNVSFGEGGAGTFSDGNFSFLAI